MKIILLFLDGVGIGPSNSDINPFFVASLPVLKSLLGNNLPHKKFTHHTNSLVNLKPVNATLGMPGLPQSGTGQVAIFTGVNGARKFGKHFGPYPPTPLRPLIEQKNIFRQLKELDKRVTFANAFPKQFFDYTASGTRRLTVTTLACLMSGVPLLRINELKQDRAISADLTRARWPELGYPELPVISPAAAGRHLWQIAREYDFTLFEYWLTDHAGHSQDMKRAVSVLEQLDAFLGGFFESFNGHQSTLIVISDHGNIEDLSTKSHTRNPVPCIIAGKNKNRIAESIKSITHVTPVIVSLFKP
jgi:2,3-bisphosphoglycerate-independent phosphoglycerate mutase